MSPSSYVSAAHVSAAKRHAQNLADDDADDDQQCSAMSDVFVVCLTVSDTSGRNEPSWISLLYYWIGKLG